MPLLNTALGAKYGTSVRGVERIYLGSTLIMQSVKNLQRNSSFEYGGKVSYNPLRKNLVFNPCVGLNDTGWSYQVGTSETGSTLRMSDQYDGPLMPDGQMIKTFMRWVVGTPKLASVSSFSISPSIIPWSGSAVSAVIYVRCSVATSVTMRLQEYKANVALSGEFQDTVAAIPANTWTAVRVTNMASNSAVTPFPDAIGVSVIQTAANILPTGATLDVTALCVEVSGASATYFDGDSISPDPELFYQWVSAAHSSPGVYLGNVVGGFSGNRAAFIQSSSWKRPGSAGRYSLRMLPIVSIETNALAYGSYVELVQVSDVLAASSLFKVSTTYTIRLSMYLPAAQTGTLHAEARQISVYSNTATGSSTGTLFASSAKAPNAQGVTDLSVTFTIPANARTFIINVWNGASRGNGDVLIDDVMITQGSSIPLYYRDGDSPGWSWNESVASYASYGESTSIGFA